MYRLMVVQFLRQRFAVILLVMLLAAGIVSLVVGKHFLDRQHAAIAETTQHQQSHIERLVKYHKDEMGLLLYYLKFGYVNPTSSLAGLCIGQRDINSSIQFPTIRTLEAQKYDTDIRNPYDAIMGNFDLSFVILFLFPLVIIALSFNLYSEEDENGTWPLILSQKISGRRYLLSKLSVPFIFVSCIYLSLLLLSIAIPGVTIHKNFMAFSISNYLYVCFWFASSLLITSFYKSSSTNAISLLSAWLIVVLLIPAAINNYITRKYPVPESLSTMVKQRDGYHKKWDIPKDSTLSLFRKEYPEYASYKWNNEGFDWLWYYAMQHLGDVDAKADRELFMQKLQQRERTSKQLSWLVPSLYTQLYNTELAETGLSNHLRFLDSTTRFHERIRKYFYPKIFTAAQVTQQDWKQIKPVYSNMAGEHSVLGAFHIGLFVLVIGAAAIINLKKYQR